MAPLPPTPNDNDARLRALGNLCILDTEPEAGYDEITSFVAMVCETPASMVSLVDQNRQWFKSHHGFDEPETNLESSICAYVVFEEGFLEIEDLTLDPRTAQNPLVEQPGGIRFYAGAPLRLSDGPIVGALCVVDTKPRRLSDFQRETLRVMARQVVAQMELRRTLEQTELLKQEVDHRVKNSLQSVSALTRIQARKARSPDVKAALGQVQARIEMVAALHEQLYRAATGSEVALESFAAKVGQILNGTSPPNVRIDVDFAPARVSPQEASAIGVILNEFASNSIKHAFPNERPGQVRMTGKPGQGGGMVIELSDDGIGMGPENGSDRIGLAVIEASVSQLAGMWEPLALPQGTAARLVLPPREAAASPACATLGTSKADLYPIHPNQKDTS